MNFITYISEAYGTPYGAPLAERYLVTVMHSRLGIHGTASVPLTDGILDGFESSHTYEILKEKALENWKLKVAKLQEEAQ